MKTGLLLVDIQNDYFPGGRMQLDRMNDAANKALTLLSLFRANQWPTVHVQHISTSEKATFFLANSEGMQIHDLVRPLPKEVVITKHFPNSFRETRLLEQLEKADVRKLVICGAMSHMCIDATTRAAADFGYQCTVIHDGCATTDLKFADKVIPAEEVHGAFMAALGAAYARVINLQEFMRTWAPT